MCRAALFSVKTFPAKAQACISSPERHEGTKRQGAVREKKTNTGIPGDWGRVWPATHPCCCCRTSWRHRWGQTCGRKAAPAELWGPSALFSRHCSWDEQSDQRFKNEPSQCKSNWLWQLAHLLYFPLSLYYKHVIIWCIFSVNLKPFWPSSFPFPFSWLFFCLQPSYAFVVLSSLSFLSL